MGCADHRVLEGSRELRGDLVFGNSFFKSYSKTLPRGTNTKAITGMNESSNNNDTNTQLD